MLVFAVVALLVGAFMIFNTFSITVAQRTRRERAAAGARRQPAAGARLGAARGAGRRRRSPRCSGSVAGLGVAAGLKALLDALGFDIPAGGLVFTPQHRRRLAGWSGSRVTLFAALSPARKAAKVPPIAAMQQSAVGSTGYGSRQRIVVGCGAAGRRRRPRCSPGCSARVDQRRAGRRPRRAAGVLRRVRARPHDLAAAEPGHRLRRCPGCAGSPASWPGRTPCATPSAPRPAASALMIGVGLVGFITIFVASTKASMDAGASTGRSPATSSSTPAAASTGGVDPGAGRSSSTRCPRSQTVTGLRVRPAPGRRRRRHRRSGVDPATAFDADRPPAVQGTPEDLDAGHHRRLQGRRRREGPEHRRHGPGGVQGHRPRSSSGRDDLRARTRPAGDLLPRHAGLRRPTSPTDVRLAGPRQAGARRHHRRRRWPRSSAPPRRTRGRRCMDQAELPRPT